MSTEVTRILLADDHPLLRRGLRQVIEEDAALQVVAEADDGEAALERITQLQPQVAVLDIDMPKLDGLGIARQVAAKRLAVDIVFLTVHSAPDLFHVAMDLGAKGYILKESALLEVAAGLRSVAQGNYYVSAPLTAHLIHRRSQAQNLLQAQTGMQSLTPAERTILKMIAESQSSKDIASALFVHYRTVENHRANICRKLGLRGAHALLKFAVSHRFEL